MFYFFLGLIIGANAGFYGCALYFKSQLKKKRKVDNLNESSLS